MIVWCPFESVLRDDPVPAEETTMIVYYPESRVRLEVTMPVHALDANAVAEYRENGELFDRVYAKLDVSLNADAPEPHDTVPGLMFRADERPSDFVESLLRKGGHVYRIVNLNTLEVWIFVLDENAGHTLLYQM